MALQHINNGDSGLTARTKINDAMDKTDSNEQAINQNAQDIQQNEQAINQNATDIQNRELLANKVTDLSSPNNITYPTTQAVSDALNNIESDNIYNSDGIINDNRDVRILLDKFLQFWTDNVGGDKITEILQSNSVQAQKVVEAFVDASNHPRAKISVIADNNNKAYIELHYQNDDGDLYSVILDERGLRYDAYSNDFGKHSLIDKAYVDNYSFNKKKYLDITSDYTIDVGTTPETLIVDSAAGDVTITLPLHTDIPDDDRIHTFFIVKKSNDTHRIIVKLSGSENYPQGYNRIELIYGGEQIRIGGSYADGWFYVGQLKIVEKVTRTSNWSSSNFSNATAIPLENEIVSDNKQVFSWDSGDPTKITANIKTRLNVSFAVDIDSTGGSTYNVNAAIYKNGVFVAGSRTVSGNYGGEDTTLNKSNVVIEMDAGDYIELYLEHNGNLSGNVTYADLQVDSLL